MRFVRFARVCNLLASAVVTLTPAARAQEAPDRKLKLSLGYHFSTGDYGEDENTDIAYIPLTLRAEAGAWTFVGTIPYLRISGPGGFIDGPTGPIQTDGSADGLGDIIAEGAYTISPFWDWMPFIDLESMIKFPTAEDSDEEGLGTGEFDFGFGTEITWTLGRFIPFAEVGYRFLGEPPDTDLNDTFLASAGALYQVLDGVYTGLFVDYREASSPTSHQQVDAIPFLSWRLTPHWSADTYVSAGLAVGSADVGTGLQIGYTF